MGWHRLVGGGARVVRNDFRTEVGDRSRIKNCSIYRRDLRLRTRAYVLAVRGRATRQNHEWRILADAGRDTTSRLILTTALSVLSEIVRSHPPWIN